MFQLPSMSPTGTRTIPWASLIALRVNQNRPAIGVGLSCTRNSSAPAIGRPVRSSTISSQSQRSPSRSITTSLG